MITITLKHGISHRSVNAKISLDDFCLVFYIFLIMSLYALCAPCSFFLFFFEISTNSNAATTTRERMRTGKWRDRLCSFFSLPCVLGRRESLFSVSLISTFRQCFTHLWRPLLRRVSDKSLSHTFPHELTTNFILQSEK